MSRRASSSSAPAEPNAVARRDAAVPWRIFVGVAVFMALIAVLYWLVSYEDAGTVMLALSCGLALLVGAWLFLQDHRRPRPPVHVEAEPGGYVDAEAAPYLPEASIWPFGMGLGALAALNGLIVGWAYAVPGAVLLLLATAGLVSQGRRRDPG
jgi:hypothetical protein